MSELQTTTPNHLKQKMRKMKKVPAAIKAVIYSGCHDPMATVQFNQDVLIYNLFEALLYVEGYEPQYYAEGTAMKAMDAFVKTPAVKKMLKEALS